MYRVLTDQAIATLIAMHRNGASATKIADALVCPVTTVKSQLLSLRKRGILPFGFVRSECSPWTADRLAVLQQAFDAGVKLTIASRMINDLPGPRATREAVRRRMQKLRDSVAVVPMESRPRVTCIPPPRIERESAVTVIRKPAAVEEMPRWMRPRVERKFTMLGGLP